jgi:hypothetical protein
MLRVCYFELSKCLWKPENWHFLWIDQANLALNKCFSRLKPTKVGLTPTNSWLKPTNIGDQTWWYTRTVVWPCRAPIPYPYHNGLCVRGQCSLYCMRYWRDWDYIEKWKKRRDYQRRRYQQGTTNGTIVKIWIDWIGLLKLITVDLIAESSEK